MGLVLVLLRVIYCQLKPCNLAALSCLGVRWSEIVRSKRTFMSQSQVGRVAVRAESPSSGATARQGIRLRRAGEGAGFEFDFSCFVLSKQSPLTRPDRAPAGRRGCEKPFEIL